MISRPLVFHRRSSRRSSAQAMLLDGGHAELAAATCIHTAIRRLEAESILEPTEKWLFQTRV
jgi:hypothetical protein